MKNLVLVLIAAIAFLMSGCSSKEIQIEYANNIEGYSQSVYHSGTVYDDMDVASPAQNLAIMFYNAAKEVKSSGYNEFVIDKFYQVPPMITKFDDIVSYCYPENGGNTAEDWTSKSSSLEDKCSNFKLKRSTTDNSVRLRLVIKKRKSIGLGHWKADEILENKNIKEMIANVRKNLKEEEIENIVLLNAKTKTKEILE